MVKISSYLVPTMAASLLLAATTSCNILTRSGKSDARADKNDAKTEIVTKNNDTSQKKADAKTDSRSAELTNRIAGEWIIIRVGKTSVNITDDMPYINFDKNDNRFYASDGCNIINGSFEVSKSGILTLDNVLSTMRLCPEIDDADIIRAALSGAQPLTIGFAKPNSEDVTIMTLSDTTGKYALTLRRSDMNFINGQWQVVKIGAKSYDNPEINLFFDLPALKVHGNTGCNYFNGDIYIDPTVGASLNFGRMGVTRMVCPDSGTETAMLVALEQVCSARPGSDNTLLLYDASGTTLMVLKRIATPNEAELK